MRYLFIVLFCEQLNECKKFYEMLGFKFIEKREGNCPPYYTALISTGLEIQLRNSVIVNDHMSFGFIADKYFTLNEIAEKFEKNKTDFEFQSLMIRDKLTRLIKTHDPEGRVVKILEQ